MAREIRLAGIGDHFEQKVINTVRKATLKAEKDIKFFTPEDTYLLMLNMQSLLLMAQICHQVGVEDIGLVKAQLKVIQNSLQNN